MNKLRLAHIGIPCLFLCVLAILPADRAQGAPFDPEHPYAIKDDGTVDWYVYSGYRRYHSDCHVCHGPDGMGSSFAPALAASMKTLSYDQFLEVVVNGRKNVNTASDKVMPAFGENANVMCFIDDLYAYLKARADDKVPRGRPAKHEDKPDDVKERDNSCMGTGG
jgi:methanol metabolism-related c-type cytochrome